MDSKLNTEVTSWVLEQSFNLVTSVYVQLAVATSVIPMSPLFFTQYNSSRCFFKAVANNTPNPAAKSFIQFNHYFCDDALGAKPLSILHATLREAVDPGYLSLWPMINRSVYGVVQDGLNFRIDSQLWSWLHRCAAPRCLYVCGNPLHLTLHQDLASYSCMSLLRMLLDCTHDVIEPLF